MTSDPSCTHGTVPSPLDGFTFTRDWLKGEKLTRTHLPDVSSMVSSRLADLAEGVWEPWTEQEVLQLAEFNLAAGNVAGASFAKALGNPETLVVVTGQQPDLLAAPLYVLHKALSAVAWAKKLSSETGRPVIPVFWVASDDDDFAELKQAWHVGFDGALVDVGAKISRGSVPTAGSPAYSWDLSESADRLNADLSSVLSGWSGGLETAGWLESALEGSANFEALFCRLLTELLGQQYPMLFVAPRLLPFRARQVPLLVEDIRHHSELNTALNDVADKFEAAGYPVTLHREAEALNFFWINDGVRHKLVRRGHEISALEPRRKTAVWQKTEKEVIQMLQSSPLDFAPNVVTRPVLQDLALPAVAYIAGPGELAYLALLGEAYTTFQKSRAAVIPRTLVTMLPTDSVKRSSCFCSPATTAGEVMAGGDDKAVQLLHLSAQLQADSSRVLQEMREVANTGNPAVARALDKTESHIRRGVERLKRRLAKQMATEEWNRTSRLAAVVAPAGSSQERMLSPWNFVMAGAWDTLARHLYETVDYTAQEPQTAPLPPWVESQL